MTNNKQSELLFETHTHLIPKLAKKFLNYGKTGIEYDDLYQEAAIGLHLAATEFDPSRWEGKTFEKFAVTRIYHWMMPRFTAQNFLYTPTNITEIAIKIKKRGLLHDPVDVIAAKLDRTPKSVEGALLHLNGGKAISLDAEIQLKSESKKIAEVIPDENCICELDYAMMAIFKDQLKGNEKTVFELLMQDKTQVEIAKEMNFSRGNAGRLASIIRKKFLEYSRVV